MRSSRKNRNVAAYVACIALALQALWPLIAQAKPRSVTLVPVCTVQGVTHYLELPAGNSPLEQKSSSQHEHCSYCSFGGERAILPSLLQHLPATGALQSREFPQDEGASFRSAHFTAGRPRAPPFPPFVHPIQLINDEYGENDEEGFALRRRGDRAGAVLSGRGVLRLGVLHH